MGAQAFMPKYGTARLFTWQGVCCPSPIETLLGDFPNWPGGVAFVWLRSQLTSRVRLIMMDAASQLENGDHDASILLGSSYTCDTEHLELGIYICPGNSENWLNDRYLPPVLEQLHDHQLVCRENILLDGLKSLF
jgi:hypothetical protein